MEEFHVKLSAEQLRWLADREDTLKAHNNLVDMMQRDYNSLEAQNHAMQTILEHIIKLHCIEPYGELIGHNNERTRSHFRIFDQWYAVKDVMKALEE